MSVRDEVVVHLFGVPDGPGTDAALDHFRGVWESAAGRLRTVLPVGDLACSRRFPENGDEPWEPPYVVAASDGATGRATASVMVRRTADVLALTLVLGPGNDGSPAAWRLAGLESALKPGNGVLLGQHRLRLSVGPPPDGAVPLRAWTGVQCVSSAPGGDPHRDLVLHVAPQQRASARASAWAVPGGPLSLPVRCLLTTDKLRSRDRTLRLWQHALDRLPEDLVDGSGEDGPAQLAELETLVDEAIVELAGMHRSAITSLTSLGLNLVEISGDDRIGETLLGPYLEEATTLPERLDVHLERSRRERARVVSRLGDLRAGARAGRRGGGVPAGDGGHVFVVYAHENDAHKDAVLALARYLRQWHGISVVLDRFYESERRNWSRWARSRIVNARHVLVVASPTCRDVLEEDFPQWHNRGVYDELSTLEHLLHHDRRTWTTRILPVLLPPYDVEHLPVFLSPRTEDHYRVTSLTEPGTRDLVDVLHGVNRVPAPPVARR
jgi:hypothetical protein